METKQVIVLRKDLNMRKGKMVAQGAHASMKVFFDRILEPKNLEWNNEITIKLTEEMFHWTSNTFTKVCVGVSSEQELLAIYQAARDAGLPCSLITDAGKTEFGGVPTKTAVAVGPAACADVDKITSGLSLL